MKEEQKSETELQQEILASQKRIAAITEKAKSYRKSSRKKPVKVWGTVLLMTAVCVVDGFALYRSPHPWHMLLVDFLPIAGLLLVFYGVDLLIKRRDVLKERRETEAKPDWYREVDVVVDVKDLEDADYLYDNLDAIQQRRLLNQLKMMPRGSRSLLKAVRTVSPDFIDDDAV